MSSLRFTSFLAIFALLQPLLAQVRISEFQANTSDRLVKRDENGVFQLGGGVQWQSPDFDASSWSTGVSPLGFSRTGSLPTRTDLETEVYNRSTSVFLRWEFDVTPEMAASTTDSVALRVQYDDGFIAYLNGQELGRGYTGGEGLFVYHDQEAFGELTDRPESLDIRPGFANQFLRAGRNVLAIQLHNHEIDDPDLFVSPTLRAGSTRLVQPGSEAKYFVGLVHPSGGVFDEGLLAVGATAKPEFEDWIELENTTSTAVDLSGWFLSDEDDALQKWTFPNGTTVPANGYLVVLADNRPDLNGVGSRLHTNFKISETGEDLFLTNPSGTIVSRIVGNALPKQFTDKSFGLAANGVGLVYLEPTPGKANSTESAPDFVDSPDFSPKGGFFDRTVMVTLTSQTMGARIRYTTDGTLPTLTNGIDYNGPFALAAIDDKTAHVINARAFRDDLLPSKPKIHSYLVGMSQAVRSLPAVMLSGDPDDTFYNPRGIWAINRGLYTDQQWSPNGPDSYNLPFMRGRPFEREARMEFYPGDGSDGFREQTGVRVSASSFSRPRLRLGDVDKSPIPSIFNQKTSFNIFFRDDYGAEEVNYPLNGRDYPVTKFSQFRIRAGKNDIVNPFIVDEVARRLFDGMDQESSVGQFNTVFVNGIYKGYYNITERLREPFMQDHYNSDAEWDVVQADNFENGDDLAWREMLRRLNVGLADPVNYARALEYVDPVNFADYYILNIYAATWDWPRANWVAARERSADGRFRFFVWDAEGAFAAVTKVKLRDYNAFDAPSSYFADTGSPIRNAEDFKGLLGERFTVSQIFRQMYTSPEWRLLFADRLQKHFFNGGILDDRAGAASKFGQLTSEMAAKIEPFVTSVGNGTIDTSFLTDWTDPQQGRRTYLFGPNRTDFADNGLWPSVPAPTLSQFGGTVSAGSQVTFTSGGTIYFTLDGTDPRAVGGAVASTAQQYTAGQALNLNQGRVMVKARRLDNGTWSPLIEAAFAQDVAAPTAQTLVVSELMYHAFDPSRSERAANFDSKNDFDFLEFTNVSPSVSLDLTGVSITDGVTFTFPTWTLGPGEKVYVVENRLAFLERYGQALAPQVAGQFQGNLSNGGERLDISIGNQDLHDFRYDDKSPWPECADGSGFSIVLKAPTTAPLHSEGANWECSDQFGGFLGGSGFTLDYGRFADYFLAGDQFQTLNASNLDADGDGLSNQFEFAAGSNPAQADGSLVSARRTTPGQIEITYQLASQDTSPGLQVFESSDLVTWMQVPAARLTQLAMTRHSVSNARLRTVAVTVPDGGEESYYRVQLAP